MLFSSWLRNWKASLERRSALSQIPRRRSSGRRFALRPRLEVLEDRTLLSIYLVTSTGDNGGINPAPGAGTGTLRQAIVDADAAGTGTAATPDQIQFAIPTSDPGYNSTTGTFTIQALSALPTISDTLVLNGTTQPGFTSTPILVLNGASAGAGVSGLTITAGNTTVEGLCINQFSGNGINLTTNGGDVIEGDYIGTDATGTTALGNAGDGVFVTSADNTIGGSTSTPGTGAGNVISGNGGWGVWLAGASNNSVLGNLLGTNASGTAALGNGSNDVEIDGNASGNTIGGSAVSDRNVIVGAGYGFGAGVELDGTGPVNNVIANNYIGTDITGMVALGNIASGVQLYQVPGSNTIGLPGAGNLISGNGYVGINLGGSSNTLVQGNRIGTNASGTAALANGWDGIMLNTGASANTIGGTAAGAGNVISGNASDGVFMTDSGTVGNVVLGNLIGTNAAGTAALVNNGDGVQIESGATANIIGGTSAGSGNIVSGNTQIGIELDSGGNLVQGNYVGTDVTGTAAVANRGYAGIFVSSADNTIGGLTSTSGTGAGNVVSGNAGYGVMLVNSGGTGNLVQGNLVGTNAAGTGALGNGSAGVLIGGASNNTIGGASAAARNVISDNLYQGVELFNGADNNLVAGNYVGTDITGTFAIGNQGNGVQADTNSTGDTIGGTTAGAGNVISGNTASGIVFFSGSNLVQGNLVGLNAAGTAALGNAGFGVYVAAAANVIGGTMPGAGNVISGNGIAGTYSGGIAINGGGASSNLVQGNLIGTDYTGEAALSNGGSGIQVDSGAAGNTIGGTTASARNVISANDGDGVTIYLSGGGNTVEGNYIGTNAAGTTSLGNTSNGVGSYGGAGEDTIGGSVAGAGNVISGNLGNGVGLYSGFNLVEGNLIGTDATGRHALGNTSNGVNLYGSNCTIGGTVAGAGNVISGNGSASTFTGGIGDGSNNNLIAGNYIGTDVSGTVAISNAWSGINLNNGASGNTIGGTTAAARNVIDGNTDGVEFYQTGQGNLVEGNYVGVNAAGTKAIGNVGNGVQLEAGSDGNTIGGTVAGAGNVISGNGSASTFTGGIALYGVNNTLIAGNYLGTDASGTVATPNAWDGITLVFGASGNTIGGTVAAARNVIGASGLAGIELFESGAGNLIAGNYVGTNATGTAAIANDLDGILIDGGSTGATIGGTAAGAGNLISGNVGNGIELSSGSSLVEGNSIGTDVTGTLALANGGDGVLIKNGDTNNTIGGTAAGTGNVIAFNATGVVVQDTGTNGNSILGNSIHDNSTLGIQLASGGNDNQAAPVLTSTSGSSSGTTVSGTLTSTANTTFRIEFFSNAGLDASGNVEGQTFLGYVLVTTDNTGHASFTATNLAAVPAGQGHVSATATNQNTGDTSPFSDYSTSTALASSANPSVFGQSITFTATVSSSFGTPKGNVDFFDTTTNTDLGTVALSSSGTTTLTVSNLTVGSHVIEAIYAGQGIFLASNGTLKQTVNAAPTTTSVSAAGTGDFGQPLTFTATVSANAPSTATPVGSVDFFDVTTNTDLGSVALSGGVAKLTIANLPVGTQTITATYTGNGNFLTSSGNVTTSILDSIYLLNSSGSGELNLSGNASINVAGLVQVDSNSTTALQASGNAKVSAAAIDVVGGVQKTGNASFSVNPITGSASVADPEATLPPPTGGTSYGAINLSGNQTLTINPGVYSQIIVSGNAKLTMNPGIYVLAGGGFTVSGNGSVTGNGVMIYNAGSNYSSTGSGGTFGAINLGGNGTINLTAATTGPYAGVLIFQERDNSQAITLGGNGSMTLGNGLIYAAKAQLTVSGNAQLKRTPLLVAQLQVSGNGSIT